MRTSVRWINDYLDRPATAEEQADALTAVGLNFDGREVLPDGAIWQEIETTSNRGDCLCHFGLARELAAKTKRVLVAPNSKGNGAAKKNSSTLARVPRENARTLFVFPMWITKRARVTARA